MRPWNIVWCTLGFLVLLLVIFAKLGSVIFWFSCFTAANILAAISMYRRPRIQRPLCIFYTIVLIAVFFSPVLWAFAWHARHGNHIQFEGRSFRIPLGWIALETESDEFLQPQLEFRTPVSNLLSAWRNPSFYADQISLGPLSHVSTKPTSEGKLKAWRDIYSTLHIDVRELSPVPTSKGSERNDFACLEETGNTSTDRMYAPCLFLQNGWTAELVGNRKNMDIFVEFVRNANLLQTKPLAGSPRSN
jgi:hypothetical protein